MHLVRHSPLQSVQQSYLPTSLRLPPPTDCCSFSLISVRAIPSANCPACLLANQSSSVVTVSFALFTPSVLLSECFPRPAVPLSRCPWSNQCVPLLFVFQLSCHLPPHLPSWLLNQIERVLHRLTLLSMPATYRAPCPTVQPCPLSNTVRLLTCSNLHIQTLQQTSCK